MTYETLLKLRKMIIRASESLTDAEAYYVAQLVEMWFPDREYARGKRVQHNGLLYRCLQPHTSQTSWAPDISPSLWVRIDDPAVEWPEWRQTSGSTDAYIKGAKVSHNSKHWVSLVDANTWEPGVYGWEAVE